MAEGRYTRGLTCRVRESETGKIRLRLEERQKKTFLSLYDGHVDLTEGQQEGEQDPNYI